MLFSDAILGHDSLVDHSVTLVRFSPVLFELGTINSVLSGLLRCERILHLRCYLLNTSDALKKRGGDSVLFDGNASVLPQVSAKDCWSISPNRLPWVKSEWQV